MTTCMRTRVDAGSVPSSVASTSYASHLPYLQRPGGSRGRRIFGDRVVARKAKVFFQRLRASNDTQEPNTAAPPAPVDKHSALGSPSPTSTSAASPTNEASGGVNSSAPSTPITSDPEAAELAGMWESLKRDMRKELGFEEAQVLDSIKVEDLLGDRPDLMRKVADEQLGPMLQSIGISEDPLTFFLDLLRLATTLQLLSAGVLFYGTEVLGGYDSGEAFRCVCGLAAGYLSRPFLRVEAVLWPLYDWVLRVVAPGTEYKVNTSPEDSATTLSRLGVAVAVCSFLPQLLWGWDTPTSLQFVFPLAFGWLLFDVMYMAALLAKLDR